MSNTPKEQLEAFREVAAALHQTDEVRASDKRCAGCGAVYKAECVWLTLCLFRDAVGKVEIQSHSIPSNWQRFGDGYLCTACWKKVREWQARGSGVIQHGSNVLGKSEAHDALSQRKVIEPVLRAVANVILDGGPEGGLGAPPFWEDRLYDILLDVFDYGETGLPPACLGALCPKCAGPDAALPDFAPMQRCQNCGVPFLIHPKRRGDSTSSQDEEVGGTA